MKVSHKNELKRAMFLDRDGVLNRKPLEHDYVKSHAEFVWNDGARELVKKIKDLGFLVIVVSNQRGVARGLMTADFVDDLHRRMNMELAKVGAHIDAFYYCPHNSIDRCVCRKPAEGMFLTAAKEWGIDLKNSFAVGDSESDTIAASKAGCKTIQIKTDIVQINDILAILK